MNGESKDLTSSLLLELEVARSASDNSLPVGATSGAVSVDTKVTPLSGFVRLSCITFQTRLVNWPTLSTGRHFFLSSSAGCYLILSNVLPSPTPPELSDSEEKDLTPLKISALDLFAKHFNSIYGLC